MKYPLRKARLFLLVLAGVGRFISNLVEFDSRISVGACRVACPISLDMPVGDVGRSLVEQLDVIIVIIKVPAPY
jgi:hypothetical protein